MIRIHNFPGGGRGLRTMWLCEEMGLSYEAVAVSFPPSAAYVALNPLGSVPFLEDDNGGAAINESVATLLYIAGRYGPTPLVPAPDDPDYGRVMQLTVFGEATLGAVMNPLMMAKFGAPEGQKTGWLTTALEGRMQQSIGYAADLLGAEDYLAAGQLTLADISVACALGIYVGALNGALPDTLVRYRERLGARPAYQRAIAVCNAGR